MSAAGKVSGTKRARLRRVSPLAIGLLLGAGGAAAAEPSVEDLLRRLEERDAAIRELQERVESLEQRVSQSTQATTAAPSPPPSIRPSPPSPVTAQVSPPAPTLPTTDEPATDEPRRAGALEVDPEAAERALERTLVLTGDLLLPPGRIDVQPSLSYTHSDDASGLASAFFDGDRVVEPVRVRRDRLTANLGIRMGLPFDAQFEAGLPYSFVEEETNRSLVGLDDDRSGTGIGDLRVGFAKTLWREGEWAPDLIGRITWDTNTGRDSDDGVSLDSGFHELDFSLTALKRQDPLAFVGRINYERAFENDDVKPGDTVGFAVGTLLAASPETSLSFFFEGSRRGETQVFGRRVEGSNQNQASVILGVSSVLGRNLFLNVNVGAGLTEDSNDYFVLASLPIRFTLWR